MVVVLRFTVADFIPREGFFIPVPAALGAAWLKNFPIGKRLLSLRLRLGREDVLFDTIWELLITLRYLGAGFLRL